MRNGKCLFCEYLSIETYVMDVCVLLLLTSTTTEYLFLAAFPINFPGPFPLSFFRDGRVYVFSRLDGYIENDY